MKLRNADPRGFSLVELMVAMAVTLVITGAIYGLMTGGQNAFRREPAMADRQQNIRLAMDVVMRDIASAGANMPPFIQTFTTGLNSCVGCPASPLGVAGTPAGNLGAPGGPRTDDLELMANPSGLGMEAACNYPGGNASHASLAASWTRLRAGDVVMVLLVDGRWTMRAITGAPNTTSTGAGDCTNHTSHADAAFNTGASDTTGYNIPGGICAGAPVPDAANCGSCTYHGAAITGNACCSTQPTTVGDTTYGPCTVVGFLQSEIVRYRIRNDAAGIPNLERFSSARSSNFAAGVPSFQVIARGIDDLQVQYETVAAGPVDNAPLVDQNAINYGSLIRRVTVTLSARSEAQNVAGAKKATGRVGPDALRGRLTSTVTPRAALETLGTQVNSGDTATSRKAGSTPEKWY
jgi:prepilin-type N-terminal cleavage/methylation domain-containing protein